jgi:hypothetical protein
MAMVTYHTYTHKTEFRISQTQNVPRNDDVGGLLNAGNDSDSEYTLPPYLQNVPRNDDVGGLLNAGNDSDSACTAPPYLSLDAPLAPSLVRS